MKIRLDDSTLLGVESVDPQVDEWGAAPPAELRDDLRASGDCWGLVLVVSGDSVPVGYD